MNKKLDGSTKFLKINLKLFDFFNLKKFYIWKKKSNNSTQLQIFNWKNQVGFKFNSLLYFLVDFSIE